MISRSPAAFITGLWFHCCVAVRRGSNDPIASCTTAPKYAIALFGGVSRLTHDAHGLGSDAFGAGEPVNISIVGDAIRRHIIEPNGGQDNVRVFIHSWAYDLKEKMSDIYAPTLAKYENQADSEHQILTKVHKDTSPPGGYCPYCGAAASLSMQKSLELVAEYEATCHHQFDRILLYRPDVLLWGQNMLLGKYNGSHITCNRHDDVGKGDFHWVFNSRHAQQFRPFDSLNLGQPPYFGWIRDYIAKSIPPYEHPRVDSFRPCQNQEVLRKINSCRWNQIINRKDLAGLLGLTNLKQRNMTGGATSHHTS